MNIRRYLIEKLKSKSSSENDGYTAKSEAEGKAIIAACLAALKLFSPATYQSHGSGKVYLINGEKMKPFRGGSLPENATFFQLFRFNFEGPLKNFILVEMRGSYSPEKQKIDWRVDSVCAPERANILSEREMAGLS